MNVQTLALAAALFVSPFAWPDTAYANCAARAREVAQETGGRVVAVSEAGPNCRIRVVVRSGNRPPRSRVVVVPK